ncbi:MAG: hypothetical protein KDC05_16650 [Bacteroidales bacterium]|nr:hypothetical protein [Bacteroidales bacterium]
MKTTNTNMIKILIALALLIPALSFGQSTSLGLRAGGTSGLSYNYFDQDGYGIELILGSKDGGMRFTGLIKNYKPVLTDRVANLFVYTGLGAHSGFISYKVHEYEKIGDLYFFEKYRITKPVVGGDFALGAEYRFESIPVSMSFDYKPYFEFFGKRTFRVDLWDFAFSIRYVFNNLKS